LPQEVRLQRKIALFHFKKHFVSAGYDSVAFITKRLQG
jgi:hypothetical protein